MLLSELGGYLLSFDKAPAGTKRISNLLRSKKWKDTVITDYLTLQAQQYVERLLEKQEEVLLLWDESVQEKIKCSLEMAVIEQERGAEKPPHRFTVLD